MSELTAFLLILVVVWVVYRIVGRYGGKLAQKQSSEILWTRDGKIFFLFLLVVLLSALNTGVNLIYLTFSVLASALMVSLLFVFLSGKKWEFQLETPVQVTAGQVFEVHIKITNRSKWLPIYGLSVSVEWPSEIEGEYARTLILKIAPNTERRFCLRGMAARRGLFTISNVSLGTSLPFGFFERRANFDLKKELLALPRTGQWLRTDAADASGTLARPKTLRAYTNTIEEFFGLREYLPGDNPRRIHWRTTARLQEPMVREYRDHERERTLIVLASVLPEDERGLNEALEAGVSFVATIAHELSRQNCDVALAAFGPQPMFVPYGRGSQHLRLLLRVLAQLEPAAMGSTDGIVPPHNSFLRESTEVILVTLGASQTETAKAVAHLGSNLSRVRLVEVTSPEFESEFSIIPLVSLQERLADDGRESVFEPGATSPAGPLDADSLQTSEA